MRTQAVRPAIFADQPTAPHRFGLWGLDFGLPLFSHGPTTRQYPAIPGNTRTMAHFLAAYCRLTVRVLPRIQFSCRVKSGSPPGLRPLWTLALALAFSDP